MKHAPNHYAVEARFERSRKLSNVETWRGPARNMLVAMRRAAGLIMKRKSVKRLRHQKITYTIEKIKAEA